MRRIKKVHALLAKATLAGVSFCLALAAAEFIERCLPEVNDTIIVPISSIDVKYHHPLRIPPLPAPIRDAVRIMFIGDSFTWGMGVRDRNTAAFPPQVQRLFRIGLVDGTARRAVQSFNLGMISYSPSIYGVVLRDFAPIVHPDIVVLALDDSDPQDDLFYSQLVRADDEGLPISVYPGLPGVPDALVPIAKRFKLFRHASGLYDLLLERHRAKKDIRLFFENRFGHYRPGVGTDEQWAEAFERSLKLVDAINRYCVKHRIKLVIINYPYAPAVTTRYSARWGSDRFNFTRGIVLDPTFHRAVREFASSRKIPYFDFTPCLRALPDLDGIFNDANGHYAERGYELLAKELVRILAPVVEEVGASRERDLSIAN